MGDLQAQPPRPCGAGLVHSHSQAGPSLLPQISYSAWAKAEQRVSDIILCIQPSIKSEQKRNQVIRFVQGLLSERIGCQVLTFGSVPLKTYLPHGDVDLVAFSSHQNGDENLANDVYTVLEGEERYNTLEFRVKDVRHINAEVKLVKCLVEDIVVDISFNQIGGICTLCFLEEIDSLIGHDHLFKRSIILVKAWCFYESRILGAHHNLLSTYALETLVLYIFCLYNTSLRGPFEVLYRFLDYFSKFDWDHYCISLQGPVPISSLPNITVEPVGLGVESLHNNEILKGCSDWFSSLMTNGDFQNRSLTRKHLNIIDPLRNNNNLGRSVNKANFHRIRSAFTYGAKRLTKILCSPEENISKNLDTFFPSILARHGSGQRPDVRDSIFCYVKNVPSMDTSNFVRPLKLVAKENAIYRANTAEECAQSTKAESNGQLGNDTIVSSLSGLWLSGGNIQKNCLEAKQTRQEELSKLSKCQFTSSCTLSENTNGTSAPQQKDKTRGFNGWLSESDTTCALVSNVLPCSIMGACKSYLNGHTKENCIPCLGNDVSNASKTNISDKENMKNAEMLSTEEETVTRNVHNGFCFPSEGNGSATASCSSTAFCLSQYNSEDRCPLNDPDASDIPSSATTSGSGSDEKPFSSVFEALKHLKADLQGSSDYHIQNIHFLRLYQEAAILGSILPNPSIPSYIQNQYTNGGSTGNHGYSRHVHSHMHGYRPLNPHYVLHSSYAGSNQVFFSGPFGGDEQPKRGTGTYFPMMTSGSYRERYFSRNRHHGLPVHVSTSRISSPVQRSPYNAKEKTTIDQSFAEKNTNANTAVDSSGDRDDDTSRTSSVTCHSPSSIESDQTVGSVSLETWSATPVFCHNNPIDGSRKGKASGTRGSGLQSSAVGTKLLSEQVEFGTFGPISLGRIPPRGQEEDGNPNKSKTSFASDTAFASSNGSMAKKFDRLGNSARGGSCQYVLKDDDFPPLPFQTLKVKKPTGLYSTEEFPPLSVYKHDDSSSRSKGKGTQANKRSQIQTFVTTC